MKAQADPADSLVFECDFAEPPEKVWRALTEPRLLETWLADDSPRTGPEGAETAPRQRTPGPEPEPAEGPDRVDRSVSHVSSSDYELVTAEPHRLLRYRWRDRQGGVGDSSGREVHSVVTVELTPCPMGGTHLRLTHGEFRIVAAVTPITSARRRTAMVSLAVQPRLRRAA